MATFRKGVGSNKGFVESKCGTPVTHYRNQDSVIRQMKKALRTKWSAEDAQRFNAAMTLAEEFKQHHIEEKRQWPWSRTNPDNLYKRKGDRSEAGVQTCMAEYKKRGKEILMDRPFRSGDAPSEGKRSSWGVSMRGASSSSNRVMPSRRSTGSRGSLGAVGPRMRVKKNILC